MQQIATSNGYAILELVRGTKEEVKAMEEEDVRQRMQVRFLLGRGAGGVKLGSQVPSSN